MKVKIKGIEVNRHAMNMLERGKKKALYLTAEAISSDIVARGVVPKDTGEIERSSFVNDERIDSELVASIVYDTPYARRWYFNADNVTFQKTKNPNAQDHWMDYYLDGEGKQWVIETYAKFLKQESHGVIK